MALAVIALAPLLASTGLCVYGAVSDRHAGGLLAVVLIGAVMLFAWRAPGKAGLLLLVFSPIWLVATSDPSNLEPQAQMIAALVWVGTPLVSGVLLVIADVVLPGASDEREGPAN